MGSKIKVELRVTTTGSVLSWDLYLENTGSSSQVKNWKSTTEYYYSILEDYTIDDDNLDVYVGSEGKAGGFTTCTVIIDEISQGKKVICKNTDKDYAHVAYKIEKI